MAAMFAYRRKFKPSRNQCYAQPHAGLGLEVYTRATSPLRRYLDLVTHQQLRAHLRNQSLLDRDAVETRIAMAEEASMQCRRAERLSNKHWTLVYLKRQKEWQGKAVLVEDRGKRMIAILPEIAMETSLRNDKGMRIDDQVTLHLESVNLHDLQAFFKTELSK
jgi:exoribonuclease-2